MRTTLIVIVAVVAYIGMGMLTWFLFCLAERLEEGRQDIAEDASFMISCMFMWVFILPMGGMFLLCHYVSRKCSTLVDDIADAIEENKKQK